MARQKQRWLLIGFFGLILGMMIYVLIQGTNELTKRMPKSPAGRHDLPSTLLRQPWDYENDWFEFQLLNANKTSWPTKPLPKRERLVVDAKQKQFVEFWVGPQIASKDQLLFFAKVHLLPQDVIHQITATLYFNHRYAVQSVLFKPTRNKGVFAARLSKQAILKETKMLGYYQLRVIALPKLINDQTDQMVEIETMIRHVNASLTGRVKKTRSDQGSQLDIGVSVKQSDRYLLEGRFDNEQDQPVATFKQVVLLKRGDLNIRTVFSQFPKGPKPNWVLHDLRLSQLTTPIMEGEWQVLEHKEQKVRSVTTD